MGREARRVPLDFDAPLNETWPGYLMPDDLCPPACPDCKGTGDTADRLWLYDWVGLLLWHIADDPRRQARGDNMSHHLAQFHRRGQGRPTKAILEVTAGLTGQPADVMFGHDSSDIYRAARKVIDAAGLDPDAWGGCPTCDRHGYIESYPGQQAACEAWEPTDPPTGDGWQMWETTGEGSPITPVFATAEELADHCADTGVSMFGEYTADRDKWLGIINGTDIAAVQIAPGVVVL